MQIPRPLSIKQPQVSKLIRELRLETKLTQEQFAAHLGLTYSSINCWENGHRQPSPLAMQKIEVLLNSLGDRGKDLLAKYSVN